MNHAHLCTEAEGKPCCCSAVASDTSAGVCPGLLQPQRLHSHPTPHFTSHWEICLVFQQNVDNPDDKRNSIG